jgi:SHS2 domain-containing protein
MFVRILDFLQNFTNLRFYTLFKLKSIVLFILSMFALDSCQSEGFDKKEMQHMADVIVDLQYLEAKANRANFQSPDSANVVYKNLEKEIFAKHKTDSARFSQDFNKLALNKEKMLEVYTMVEKIVDKRVKYNQGKK